MIQKGDDDSFRNWDVRSRSSEIYSVSAFILKGFILKIYVDGELWETKKNQL